MPGIAPTLFDNHYSDDYPPYTQGSHPPQPVANLRFSEAQGTCFMPESHTTCRFTEGNITLPDHYQDRTVNVFTLPGKNTPAFNISRDSMNDDETLSAYIDRQLTLMQKHLKGWKQTERMSVVLGNNLLQGECVHASYLRDGKRVFQQQAVFNSADNHILVFTMTCTAILTDGDNQQFQALLSSFCFNT